MLNYEEIIKVKIYILSNSYILNLLLFYLNLIKKYHFNNNFSFFYFKNFYNYLLLIYLFIFYYRKKLQSINEKNKSLKVDTDYTKSR